MIKEFTDLKIWQLSHSLTLLIYKLTDRFPRKEIFGIESQIRRSAASVGANIAEGFSRNSTKEFIQFLCIARGSLTETINFLILAKDLNYFKNEEYSDINDKYTILNKQINALIKVLRNKI